MVISPPTGTSSLAYWKRHTYGAVNVPRHVPQPAALAPGSVSATDRRPSGRSTDGPQATPIVIERSTADVVAFGERLERGRRNRRPAFRDVSQVSLRGNVVPLELWAQRSLPAHVSRER